MSRPPLVLTAPLLVCAALAACSSSTTPASGSAATAPPTAPPPSSSAPVDPPTSATPGPGPAEGSIRFRGALSGTMTLSSCPEGGPAQLVVAIEGEQRTYAGVIDTDDFAFVGPRSTGYTLADGSAKPTVSAGTYTVEKATLVGVFDDDTITADGTVTCPTR